ncbi:PLC-like phosphodiesterase [Tricholoma matsutake]|nr:PLC-like phosphodiesterase [Tricholoma matsutake 945]
MLDPEVPLGTAPRRILHRAGNLLTSNGHVEPTIKHFIDDHSSDSSPTKPPNKLKLSTSIKLKFKEVKDGVLFRSRSLQARSNIGDAENLKRLSHHTRSASVSDVTITTKSPEHPRMSIDSEMYALSTKERLASVPETTKQSKMAYNSRSQTVTETGVGDVTVPQLLQEGTPMTKVSAKQRKRAVFRLDPDIGQIIWESKKHGIIPIENIKELRSGPDARYYREQFQLAAEYEDRWLSIIYILDGQYKTLHLIASTKDVFRMWDITLRKLHDIRKELMSGLGNIEMRQAIWEKHYWRAGDEESGQKLTFEEVERLCKRLNVSSSSEQLERLFKQADMQNRNYLDFEDFRRFVKLLKGRPEIDRLYKKLCRQSKAGGVFDFGVFEAFMREKQKTSLTQDELRIVFENPASAPACIMTLETFTSFLLSPDNSAFTDQHGSVWHDMTRPLPDYYISSSHNTYLVGHQLVGVSTIEGYIRALLHSCRSVELDIYDGDTEPMIFHGKTFTSKVSLREVCLAIAKYGFVASPYPIIISAEIHCSLPFQDLIAEIMMEVFGDRLVSAPIAGRQKIDRLPSPEELKGRILLKAKNLYVGAEKKDGSPGTGGEEFGWTSSASTSVESTTEDSEVASENRRRHGGSKRRESDTMVKDLKDDLLKAGSTVLQRVRSVGKSSTRGPTSVMPPSQTHPHAPPPLKSTSLPSPHLHNGSEPHPSGSVQNFSMSPRCIASPPPMLTPTPTTASSTTSSIASPVTTVPPSASTVKPSKAPKMSFALLALLVYTVGVKCRGINKKEFYSPENMFSLSENTANKMLKAGTGMHDLIKHCRTHLVRVYPKGLRLNSTNFEPHRYWSAGAQLVAINWQTFDLGYMINHAMFQRNGRSGYVLKPLALRERERGQQNKDLLMKRTKHHFDVSIISAQQLPRPKDSSGREIVDSSKPIVDPFVEVSLHVPDWTTYAPHARSSSPTSNDISNTKSSPRMSDVEDLDYHRPGEGMSTVTTTAARTISYRTTVVKNNGFNPVWEEKMRIPFDCVGDMRDLIFVRFVVRQGDKEDVEPLAVYCASLSSLGQGYRHLPLHDTQLSQYLFSTLFVRISVTDS